MSIIQSTVNHTKPASYADRNTCKQDYLIVMCEGSKAWGSSMQARLDDRLTAVLPGSLGSIYKM